ncbi:MAG: GTPase-activating protein [Idiomarina sp.]|nr:GTPase-activating protein [Idiomarina sp.]
MTRMKKTRKSGPLAAKKADRKPTPSVSTPKQKEKGKGRAAGSRYSGEQKQNQAESARTQGDARVGSKTPVPLTVTKKPQSAKQEFAELENNSRLQTLLEQMENGEILKKADQQWVDVQLARYQELAEQLGIDLDAEDEDDDDFEYDFNENDILDDEDVSS